MTEQKQAADDTANAGQLAFWNGPGGDNWVDNQVEMDRLLEGFVPPLLDAAELRAGMRCVDIGCGCGATTLALRTRLSMLESEGGNRLDPHDRAEATGVTEVTEVTGVTGVDISQPMLAHARQRAQELQLHIDFEQADASTHEFPQGSVDRFISRFGVMFFDDPTAAFGNLRRALAPGGLLAFFCWQDAAHNPWMRVPMGAILPVLMPDAPQPAPGTPGPFALGDATYLTGILDAAGFAGHSLTEFEHPMGPVGSIEEAIAFYVERGPVAALLQGADPALRAKAIDALRTAVKAHHDGQRVDLPGNAYLVVASA